MHGDYLSLRTRAEAEAYIRETGQGDLELLKRIPDSRFLPISKLKKWMRAGRAVSELYTVKVKKRQPEMGGRQVRKTCLGCGEKFDPKRSDQKWCKPSCGKKAKRSRVKKPAPTKSKQVMPVKVKGKRRRRCAREGCDNLFFPTTAKHIYCNKSCRNIVSRKRKVEG